MSPLINRRNRLLECFFLLQNKIKQKESLILTYSWSKIKNFHQTIIANSHYMCFIDVDTIDFNDIIRLSIICMLTGNAKNMDLIIDYFENQMTT